jgi:alpha-mannosidase
VKQITLVLVLSVTLSTAVLGQKGEPDGADPAGQPTLYLVGYAHLDTQWNWEYTATIDSYLPKTMKMNFDLFEKYPHYIFNFSGANRYRLMREYYPADYAKVKHYVDAGRWFPAGSSMEEGDVNLPSAESIMRQILYGKEYFRKDFGKTSAEYMLPDCFGFPASLPSILAHMGIKGFSTAKLSWGSSAPVGGPNSPEKTPAGHPFNVGVWVGPDGKSVIAALNPGTYVSQINTDLSNVPPPPNLNAAGRARQAEQNWVERVNLDGEASGVFADYHYYGTGDMGGAPSENSVKWVEAIVTKGQSPVDPNVHVGNGPLKVVSATSEQMFVDIKPELKARLPQYRGDLLLTNHSAGTLTSQAYMKRWNRQNEVLAQAAEEASVAAEWLGGRPYPMERLNAAWNLVMGAQFHDLLPGTASTYAFEFSWNDEVLAMNQFSGVLTSATGAVSSVLNTQGHGIPVVVFNPLNKAREDVVETTLSFPAGVPKAVRVTGPDGTETPSQISGGKVLFLAKAPSVGYAVYDVQAAETPAASAVLKVTQSTVENARYKITIDVRGDVASIYDKSLKMDLLLSPARLEIKTDNPKIYPAWNMEWEDQIAPPRAFVGGRAGAIPPAVQAPKVRIVENGAARVALEISRQAEGSTFVQTVRLSAGDSGNRVEIANIFDWNTKGSHVKAVFPLSATNPVATYNMDLGVIQRGTDTPTKFEAPSHQWVDLTDQQGAFGVTLLTDCKFGSDKPDDNTLRLTLLRSPAVRGTNHDDNASQDIGHHEFVYGLAGHAADWRKSQTDWQAYRLNQPMAAFETGSHAGALGKTFSMLNVSNGRLRVLALKKAQTGDETIVRLVEMDGKAEPAVQIGFAGAIASAREVNGAEEPVGPATVIGGKLVTWFTPFQPRTFAVKLALAAAKAAPVYSKPVTLAYDLAVASADGTKSATGFDAHGNTFPAEMLPLKLSYNGVQFDLAPARTGTPNAVIARGQTIDLPAGQFNRIFLIAAADGDQKATFRMGDKSTDLTIQNWGGFIGSWDDRVWKPGSVIVPPRPGQPAGAAPETRFDRFAELVNINPGFIKRDPVAWFASHHHTAEGKNEPYSYSYLFGYALDLPPGARAVTLPENEKIRILAISVAQESGVASPAQPLYDTLER